MKFSIERAVLVKAANQAQSVVERRNTIPILANVLIEADGAQVSFRATDLDIEYTKPEYHYNANLYAKRVYNGWGHAEPETELGQLCNIVPGIAVCVEPESVNALVCGIQRALRMPKVNTVARDYAERTLDKENVLSQFLADIRGT